MIGPKGRVGLGIAGLAALGILGWQLRPEGPVALRGAGDTLTIAATGDSLLLRPTDAGLRDVGNLLRGASLAVTNLEESLLDPAKIPPGDDTGEIRWPYGTKRTARDLRRLGFTIVSLANNHAIDYGQSGLKQTEQILAGAGLFHAGTGENLTQARAPVFVGTRTRRAWRVAMIAVAASASPESRATDSRGEIMGRPGVSALGYAANVTVDAATFATLRQSPLADPSAKNASDRLMVSGTAIRKGLQTSVEMAADEKDSNDILARIGKARTEADVVVVSVHSHEPSNQSEAPAAFLRQFARAAIDAGASLVIGQGPHQLRGIEVYKGGVICYSLGNFVFDFSGVDPRSEDVFESGVDLYRLALGAVGDSEPPPRQAMANPEWWESVIAVAAFERGSLRSVRLQPIDLGTDLPVPERGTPRIAAHGRGERIIERLRELSRDFGTQIRIENETGVIELAASNR